MERRIFGVGYYLLYLVLFVCFAACTERQEYQNALNQVETLNTNDRPDSALTILNGLMEHQKDFSKHFLMLCRLHRQNAFNKLDTLFHSTEEVQTLAEYFDDNGTPNEQMLAYYLMGRAYYDTHEAPMALSCFQKAIERADTSANDCNYRQLSRVYGQMSDIFYYQNLMEEDLKYTNLSIKYAWKAKDTLNAIRCIVGKVAPFEKLSMKDSALYSCEYASKLAKECGYRELSAAILGAAIPILIDIDSIRKAKSFMDIYESESGYFDSNRNIEKGREVYYYTKGNYYLSVGKYDSAGIYFRKELQEGKNFNNQNAGSRGLALLYQKKQIPDSVAKYALYSYAMNDSVYAQMAIDKVEQMQSLYDYSRHQEIAQIETEKREKAEQRNRTIQNICIGLLVIVFGAIYFVGKERKRRKEEHKKYDESVSKLAKAQVELNKLRSHQEEYEILLNEKKEQVEQLQSNEKDLNQIIRDKEQEVARLSGDVESYKEKIKTQKTSAEATFEKSEIYQNLKKKAAKAEKVTDEEWQNIYAMTIKILPNFYKLISSNKHKLNDNEFKTCILIRLLFIPKEIAYMIGLSQPSITKIRNNMTKKLFDEEGKSKELDERLKDYS